MQENSAQAWTDQSWEVIQSRDESNDFIPMQVEVIKQEDIQVKEGLLQEKFDIPIQYASGARSHRSIQEVKLEQEQLVTQEQILANSISITQEELDQRLAEAFQRGRAESAEQEAQQYKQKISKIEQNITTLIKDLIKQEKEVVHDIESAALELSLQISKKIIEEAVEINPEYILPIIKDALRLSGGARIKKVKVSPQDMEFIEIFKVAENIKEFDGSWEFEADESVKTGCILESSAGVIDFQLDQTWSRIKDKVLALKK